MEWTLPLQELDDRGNRRYFSIASSPTESELLIAARFYPKSSRYKQGMAEMEHGDPIVAAELSGDFVLPCDPEVPLVFIAGGIGVTPFRSMVKYLVDTREKRDVVLIYSNTTEDQIVFRDVFDGAMIRKAVPDYRDRTYFISGSPAMVEPVKRELRSSRVPRRNVRSDYFPGY